MYERSPIGEKHTICFLQKKSNKRDKSKLKYFRLSLNVLWYLILCGKIISKSGSFFRNPEINFPLTSRFLSAY